MAIGRSRESTSSLPGTLGRTGSTEFYYSAFAQSIVLFACLVFQSINRSAGERSELWHRPYFYAAERAE